MVALTAQGLSFSWQEWGCELSRGDLLEPAASTTPWRVKGAVHRRRHGPRHRQRTASTRSIERQAHYDQSPAGRRGEALHLYVSLLDAEAPRSVPLNGDKYCTEQLLIASDLANTICGVWPTCRG